MPEKRYTLDEARHEMRRRECAHDGHPPSQGIRAAGLRVALRYVCDCGNVTWVPGDVREDDE